MREDDLARGRSHESATQDTISRRGGRSGARVHCRKRAHAQGQQQVLVIQGGTLIDGNGGAPVPNSVIVIQGNRITAVGRAGAVQVPAGATVINATGKWITPGLIDSMAIGNWMYGEAYLHFGRHFGGDECRPRR